MNNEMLEFYKNALQGVVTNPLCADFKNKWRICGDDKERLMKLVMCQQSLPYFITHCWRGKGLSKEYILKEFGNYINGKRSIYNADDVKGFSYGLNVGLEGISEASNDIEAYMWCNFTRANLKTAKCPTIYIGCDSEVRLTCDGYNSVRVYLFDTSKLIIDADNTCSIIAYKYSEESVVDVIEGITLENLRVFDKELKL